MARFDESCTDRRVTRDQVERFIADPRRLGEAFLGAYAVWTSSGTTGTPGVYLHDTRALAVYDALEAQRLCGMGQAPIGGAWLASTLRTPFGEHQRYAMVGATGGHFAGNASVERMRRIWPWAGGHARVLSILQPLPDLVRELDAFAPTVLATYPTAAELLAEEKLAGRLTLQPRELWLGGEQLVDATRARIARAFDCRVREGYGASECLSIAWDCSHGALHVNSDWVVLEPIDRAGEPVAPGTASHSVLLTNLANRVQPMIRYDLGDSVTIGAVRCACGSPFPTLRIEGRRDDVLEFDGRDGPVKLLPLALVTVMEDEAGAFDFQLVARDRGTLVLRLEHDDGRQPLRSACRHVLRTYLDRNGLASVTVVDDDAPPQREPVSGKLRRVKHAR
jgi:phenylacetate-CoA ligase